MIPIWYQNDENIIPKQCQNDANSGPSGVPGGPSGDPDDPSGGPGGPMSKLCQKGYQMISN